MAIARTSRDCCCCCCCPIGWTSLKTLAASSLGAGGGGGLGSSKSRTCSVLIGCGGAEGAHQRVSQGVSQGVYGHGGLQEAGGNYSEYAPMTKLAGGGDGATGDAMGDAAPALSINFRTNFSVWPNSTFARSKKRGWSR